MKSRILVIEDNPDNLELMTYLLSQFGYTTLTAMDGEEGLSAIKRENPDLIICDIQLPKLNGYEIVKQLKSDSKLSKIPLIAVTAYSMVGDRSKILASGYDGYIPKPIDPESFIKEVEQFLKVEQRSINRLVSNDNLKASEKIVKEMPAKLGTILVVDDRADNRELLRTLLESVGFKTILSHTVQQALKILEKTRPDLILSDMHIPDINGLDFLKIVKNKEILKSIPFIIMSSSSPTGSQQKECIEYGAIKIIIRPIDPQLFIKTIEEVWETIKNTDLQSEK